MEYTLSVAAMAENTAVVRVALLIAVLAGFITPFDGSSVNIALPTMGAEFGLNAVELSWISTAYLLASALFLVPFGKIADIYGRKRIFTIGISIFTLGSFLMVFSASALMLILFRVIQGLGGAMIYGTGIAILTSVYPVRERGKALGIYITSVYIGLTIGPFLGGLMTQYLGWRSIFLVNIPLGIITIGLILWRLHGEWAEARGEKFDVPGSLLYSLTLVSVMYGFSILPGITGLTLVAFGIAVLILFLFWEARTPAPVLDVRLFTGNRVFAFSNLAALINYSATFAISFLLSLYLQYIRGFTPESAGFVLVAAPIVQAAFSPFAGRLSDRIEPGILASGGMILCAAGLLFLVFVDATTSIALIVADLVVIGLGFAFFSSPNTNAIMSSVEKKYYGVASGIQGTMRLLGQMLSMGFATMVFSIVIGMVMMTPEVYQEFLLSMKVIFITFTVLCGVGVFFSLVRGKLREAPKVPV